MWHALVWLRRVDCLPVGRLDAVALFAWLDLVLVVLAVLCSLFSIRAHANVLTPFFG